MKIEVLKFYANWCGPCKALSQRLEGEKFTEVNIDAEHKIAVKHRVRTIPTLVFLKDEEEVHRTTGLITKAEYNLILNKINDEKDIEDIEVTSEIVSNLKKEI